MKFLRTKKRLVVLAVVMILLLVIVPVAQAWPFYDVPVGYWAYNAIRRVAYLNITAGCGGGNYCPEAYVTRAQMAGFLNNLTKAYTDQDEPYILNMDHRDIAYNRPAIVGQSNDGTGLVGISYGAGVADNGVGGQSNSTSSLDAGVYGVSTDYAAGVYGANVHSYTGTSASFGVRAYSAQGHGIYSQGGAGADDYGGYFAGHNGVNADASDHFALVADTDSAGTTAYAASVFDAAQWNAVAAVGGSSTGTGRGVWAESRGSYGVQAFTNVSGGYGFYTSNRIYAGGGYYGSTWMIIAENGSDETLEAGDVVTVLGLAKGPTEFYAAPVLAVRKVDDASNQSIVGVVEGRYVSEIVTYQVAKPETRYVELADPEAEKNGEDAHEPDLVPVVETAIEEVTVEEAHATTDPAAPGDLMTLVCRGIVQVKADASFGAIQVGDRLAPSSTVGHVMKADVEAVSEASASVPFMGVALEPLADGQGLIWVLVDLQ